MTGKELELRDDIEIMDAIATLWVQGNRNPTAIAKQLHLSRAEVLKYIDEYKAIIRDDPEVKARAKESLYEADRAVADVQKENWDLLNAPGIDTKTKATVLKNISDIEFKKVETWQKAGLYDDAALGDEIAQMEEKAEAIKQLLKEVAHTFPAAREMIQRGLGRIFGQPVGVVVEGEVVVPERA